MFDGQHVRRVGARRPLSPYSVLLLHKALSSFDWEKACCVPACQSVAFNCALFPPPGPCVLWAACEACQRQEAAEPFIRLTFLRVSLSFVRSSHPQVRVFDGQRVKRVSARRPLSPGNVLLYPKELDR